MIHLPWGSVEGTSEEIKNYGDYVEKSEKRLIDHYKNVLNLTEEAVRPLLKGETYLTDDQAISIGFATKISDVVVAKAYINLKNNDMSTYTKKELDEKFQKSEGLLQKILNKITGNGKIKALILQDANGSDVDFTDLKEGETPKIGDKATLDGQPIPDGDYVFPSMENITISFLNGEVAEVATPEEEGQETEALKTENADLKAQIETLKAQNSTHEENLTEATTAIKAVQKEFKDLKKSVGSSYNYKSEKNGNQGNADDERNPPGTTRTPIKK